MDWIAPIQSLILKWWAYIQWCQEADILAPACQSFWSWSIGALLGAVILVLVWLVFKFVAYQMKVAASLRAEAARAAVADEETMRAHEWEGDKAYQTNLPADEVEQRIKDALVARRNEGKPPPVV